MLSTVVFDKDLFVETFLEIEKQFNHDLKCSNAFKVLLPNDYISSYDNHWLLDQLIKILKIAMNDDHKDSWIDYFIWELDFGRKWKNGMVKIDNKDFELATVYDLWNLLNIDN